MFKYLVKHGLRIPPFLRAEDVIKGNDPKAQELIAQIFLQIIAAGISTGSVLQNEINTLCNTPLPSVSMLCWCYMYMNNFVDNFKQHRSQIFQFVEMVSTYL